MVATGLTVKTRIENKIFKKPPATDIIITPRAEVSAGSLGGYDGFTLTEGTAVTTIGVPYSTIRSSRVYYNFGTDAEGQTKIAIKSSESVKKGDKITISTTNKVYEVTEIEDYYYNNLNLAIVLTIKEII